VAKVKTRHVHASLDETSQNSLRIAGGADGADDLGSTHFS